MKSRRRAPLAAVIALLSLVLGAGGCGDDDDSPPDQSDQGVVAESGSFPVTVEDATGEVVVESRPERIVSLSPSATETLFAVGAGDQVVAVDDQSDYPQEAPITDLSAFQPNVEAIADYEPDLVIAPADVPRDLIGGLRKLNLTVLAEPAAETLNDAYGQAREIGLVTGHPEEGVEVADEMRSRIEDLIDTAPKDERLSVFHELDQELFSPASDTFIGRIYVRLGLANVADPAAEKSGSPYPQVSEEAVIEADPDLVILADSECCGQTPAKVAERPGWDEISAVQNDAVVAIDDDIASRWGPRLPIFVERVVGAMELASEGQPGGP
jgi:iron complex transport system substrate-binding protein